MILVDVNLLTYVVNEAATQHERVVAWWTAALCDNEPIGVPWIVAVGFLRVSTNPRVMRKTLSADEAIDCLNAWLSHPNVGLVLETPQQWRILQNLLRETGTSGNRTNEAHLAALAISLDATLASCDTDFGRFRRLRWVNPAAIG